MHKSKVLSDKSVKIVPQMSMAEFKAWLEGFSECFKTGAPNKVQWKRIEERLGAVSIQQEIIYRDRPYWWGQYTWNPNWNLIGTGTGYPVKLSETIMCSNNASETFSTDLIAAATSIGQEEAKEFTV